MNFGVHIYPQRLGFCFLWVKLPCLFVTSFQCIAQPGYINVCNREGSVPGLSKRLLQNTPLNALDTICEAGPGRQGWRGGPAWGTGVVGRGSRRLPPNINSRGGTTVLSLCQSAGWKEGERDGEKTVSSLPWREQPSTVAPAPYLSRLVTHPSLAEGDGPRSTAPEKPRWKPAALRGEQLEAV